MSDDAKREGLLPCPFCGGEAAYLRNEECDDKGEPSENYGGEWVECSKCHACTNIRFPLKEPVKPLLAEQWNRRAAPVSVRAGSTIIMDGSTEGSVELRELQGAVQESLPAATARGNSSPAGVESGPSALSPASAQTPAGERERFERWAAALDEPRYENGDYKNDHVQTQWEAWQAALFAPPAQPSKVVTALRELVDCADADRILAMYTPGYRWYDAIVAARAALAELALCSHPENRVIQSGNDRRRRQ